MEMTLRWYGSKSDSVTLQQIRQIPGVTGIITTLYETAPGDLWKREAIHVLKEEVEASGLHISGIESVNIHDSIKIGSPDRDQYIDNYIKTLEYLGEEDIHLVCYNFMPSGRFHRACLQPENDRQHRSDENVRFHFRRFQRLRPSRLGTGTYGPDQGTVRAL